MPALLFGITEARLLAAAGVALFYLAYAAYFLRSNWRRKVATTSSPTTTLIAFASQTGFAQQLATQTAHSLQTAGNAIRVASIADLDAADLANAERALFIVSTTGEGDAPDPAASFVRKVLTRDTQLNQLRYGLLALGDREYDNFCAFGHQLDSWLRRQGARSLFDVIEVDNGDDGALRHWQHNLSLAFDAPDLPDWEPPIYERWQLVERRLLNPGSAGDPCFHLALQTSHDVTPAWNAGDIAEIDPFNSQASGNERHPHREYSIASVPMDGALHLLVRQMRRPGGELGLGSGWLTRDAALDSDILLRIRSNPNFHLPTTDAPMIFIGNGTGIAGLRALLKARIDTGQHRNWLLWGERNAAHDLFYSEDISQWQTAGYLAKLDLVFSRDQPERRYVQHRLMECAAELRSWIDDGAFVYVCGSLEGMAPGIHAALVDTLGNDIVERLTLEGRYRRDVY
jgi:sulfite reductase (NADPH) flavoprotein alpha-component